MIQQDFAGKTNEELLAEYSRTKDQKIKQEIVLRYAYLVKNVAIQFRGVYASFAQMDDIVHEGIIALMAAVDKYQPEQNVKFETFVSKRLRGLIVDLARKQDWIPRNVRKNAKHMDTAVQTLFERLGRYPTNEEVAEFMQMDVSKYLKLQEKTNLYHLISLDACIGDYMGESPIEQIEGEESSPEEEFEKKELSRILQEGLKTLRPKEQLVLSLYYRKELTMKEIAEVMQLSEPRISQIHSNALRSLRVYIQDNFRS